AAKMREALVLDHPVMSRTTPHRSIAAINGDGSATVYDIESARPTATVKAAGGRIVSIALSGDNQKVAAGSSDGAITIWEIAGGRELAVLTGHQGAVHTVAFGSRDKDLLLSTSADGSARLWRISERKPFAILPGHDADVASLMVRLDLQRAV